MAQSVRGIPKLVADWKWVWLIFRVKVNKKLIDFRIVRMFHRTSSHGNGNTQLELITKSSAQTVSSVAKMFDTGSYAFDRSISALRVHNIFSSIIHGPLPLIAKKNETSQLF